MRLIIHASGFLLKRDRLKKMLNLAKQSRRTICHFVPGSKLDYVGEFNPVVIDSTPYSNFRFRVVKLLGPRDDWSGNNLIRLALDLRKKTTGAVDTITLDVAYPNWWKDAEAKTFGAYLTEKLTGASKSHAVLEIDMSNLTVEFDLVLCHRAVEAELAAERSAV